MRTADVKPVDLDALEYLYAKATQGEWLRDGALVYTLVHSGWWKGVEQFQNRGTFRAHVQRLPSGETTESAEAQAIADTEYLHFALRNFPALIAELRELRELVGCATEFQISARITIAKRAGRDTVRWAVYRDRSFCLANDGEWEYEPLPSSRSDEFIARCRYATLAKALEAARKWEDENA